MRLKWYATAMILLEQDGVSLLFDPFFSKIKNRYKASVSEFSAVKNIFVTHGHVDHITGIPDLMNHYESIEIYCTATPREVLISKGVVDSKIHEIKPGDNINITPFEVHVFNGNHIVADRKLVLKTVLNPRMLIYPGNLRYLYNENKVCIEEGETVVFNINTADKRVLLMGSLNLDDIINYPGEVDLLIMPFQGRSDISEYAIDIIKRLTPKKILLDHFDDSFPPISSQVDTRPFISLMQNLYPDISVIFPKAGSDWINI